MKWLISPVSLISLIAVSLLAACASDGALDSVAPETQPVLDAGTEVATFAAGCFWCSEACFEQLEGVFDVQSGFMGGLDLPAGTDARALVDAGYAEVVQVTFDPSQVSYATLLKWFWAVHDPTSLNRQGEDEGPEYRSAVFFHSEQQHQTALRSRGEVAGSYLQPIVTEITVAGGFHPATQEHQDYYRRNRESAYCQRVIAPHLRDAGLEDG